MCGGALFCLPAPLNLPSTVRPNCANDVDDNRSEVRSEVLPADFLIGCRHLFSRAKFPPLLVGHSGFMHLENKPRDDKRHRDFGCQLPHSGFLVRVTRRLQLRPADQIRLQKVKSLIGFFWGGGRVGVGLSSGSDSR